MLVKKVGLCCNSTHIFLTKFNIFIEGKERPAKTNVPKKTPPSVILCGVRLRAVLDTFGSAVNFTVTVDLAQCYTAQSLTRHSITLPGVGLGAVSHCVESDLAQC